MLPTCCYHMRIPQRYLAFNSATVAMTDRARWRVTTNVVTVEEMEEDVMDVTMS